MAEKPCYADYMETPESLVEGTFVDGYELLERLGRGGQAQVWLARHTGDESLVALKFLAPGSDTALAARFRRESRILAQLDHPNIVGFHDLGFFGGRPYLVLEYVAGQSLEERLTASQEEGRRLTTLEALSNTCELLAALHYLEGLDLFHRDIKPANLLLDRQGRLHVADFGLARFREMTRLTLDDLTVGTISYMSPEMMFDGVGDHRSDIYQAGLVLYQMVYGDLPFPEMTGYDRAVHRCSEKLQQPNERPGSVARDLAAIIDRACALAPDERFGHAADMLAALDSLARTSGLDVQMPSLTEPAAKLVTEARALHQAELAPVSSSVRQPLGERLAPLLPGFAFAAGMALGVYLFLN